jgi:ATP-dependent helicase/nuclease subunit A
VRHWTDLAGRVADGRAQELEACWVIPALRTPAPEATSELAEEQLADAEPIPVAAPVADAAVRSALPIGVSVTALVATEPEPEWGERAGAHGAAALVGTAIHAALERLDLDAEPAVWSAQRERISEQIRASSGSGARDRALADALACWDALCGGPLATRMREIAPRILARELPVLLGPGEECVGFVTGSIDLLYRDEDGRLVVVDYKTDRERGEAGALRYAKQGQLYCRAVAEALGADPPPRFEIWWLRCGQIEAIL